MVDPRWLGLAGPGFGLDESGNSMGRMEKFFGGTVASYSDRVVRYGKSSKERVTVYA